MQARPAGMQGPLPTHGPMLAELRGAQRELHLWGDANRVLFDPSKETFHILHRTLHFGQTFKVLGCVFDPQLRMHAAAKHVATEAGWRLQTLLRSRRFFTHPELVHLYKAQVLSFIESSTPGLYHAALGLGACGPGTEETAARTRPDRPGSLARLQAGTLVLSQGHGDAWCTAQALFGYSPASARSPAASTRGGARTSGATAAPLLATSAQQTAQHALRLQVFGPDEEVALRLGAQLQQAAASCCGLQDGEALPEEAAA